MKVALVTGAGTGLGEAFAEALAQAGFAVVVNDLGVAHAEHEAPSAERVAQRIRERGGQAVADGHSVAEPAGAEAMVRGAVEAFGRLDVVVNNAGIVRDGPLLRMRDEAWDEVLGVHLTGTFLVTRAALGQMTRRGQGGRIINVSSWAGLVGSAGQANYAAAKAGVAGLTRALAMEAQRLGVSVNAIAPMARTRMTEGLEALPPRCSPADVAPLVVWLAERAAPAVTGRVFGAHGARYFEYRVEQTPGAEPAGARWSSDEIEARLDQIGAPRPPAEPAGAALAGRVAAFLEAWPQALDAASVERWRGAVRVEVEGVGAWALRFGPGPAQVARLGPGEVGPEGEVRFRSAGELLALGQGEVGWQRALLEGRVQVTDLRALERLEAALDLERAARLGGLRAQRIDDQLVGKRYDLGTFEVTEEALRAYAEATGDEHPEHTGAEGAELIGAPLFPVRPLVDVLFGVIDDPEVGIDRLRLVHGEQDMVLRAPLRPGDRVERRGRIVGIERKSSGQLVRLEQRLVRGGEVVTEATSVLFVRDELDAQPSPRQGDTAPAAYESRAQVSQDQSLRYAAASGDRNPLHTDPEVARQAGWPGVIVHGLCTMAMASRALVEGPCEGESRRLARFRARFVHPVYPGQELVTRCWPIEGQPGAWRVETVDGQGRVVLGRGEAVVRAQAPHGAGLGNESMGVRHS